MLTFRSLLCLAHLLPGAYGVISPLPLLGPSVQQPLQSLASKLTAHFSTSSFERWLEAEEQIAVERLTANLSPIGNNAKGAAPGAVIASPSRGQSGQPDYFYQCAQRLKCA